jgi:signal recognition particle subunit SEC65
MIRRYLPAESYIVTYIVLNVSIPRVLRVKLDERTVGTGAARKLSTSLFPLDTADPPKTRSRTRHLSQCHLSSKVGEYTELHQDSHPNRTSISILIMSRHVQVEEVSDSDPEEIAPSDFDDADFPSDSIISPSIMHPPPPSTATRPSPQPPQEIPKNFQCLYAVYFDKARSRGEGRQVSSKLAVENPLARDILDACQQLGLRVGFEPEKLHPKDWANPGRVRVLLKDEDGNLLNPQIKNSTADALHPHPATQ